MRQLLYRLPIVGFFILWYDNLKNKSDLPGAYFLLNGLYVGIQIQIIIKLLTHG